MKKKRIIIGAIAVVLIVGGACLDRAAIRGWKRGKKDWPGRASAGRESGTKNHHRKSDRLWKRGRAARQDAFRVNRF